MSDSVHEWQQRWQANIVDWAATQLESADAGHGIDHVRRVVNNAIKIGQMEGADPSVYLPAAWLHDCVCIPKNSPQRKVASRLCADRAVDFLRSMGYPTDRLDAIHHCIHAHSFSANVDCQTLEAKVVQDADRLEAVGAIGLARCLMTGGAMRQRLYHPTDPFPTDRVPVDTEQSVDHFFSKLLGLKSTMKTHGGRFQAEQRTDFLIVFLRQLADELGVEPSVLENALVRLSNAG